MHVRVCEREAVPSTPCQPNRTIDGTPCDTAGLKFSVPCLVRGFGGREGPCNHPGKYDPTCCHPGKMIRRATIPEDYSLSQSVE